MSSLAEFVEAYGLFAIVVGTLFEGETILVLGGLAAHRGYLPLSSVFVAGFIGSWVGDQIYFHLGRRHGASFLAHRGSWRTRVARAQRILERHHIVFILGFRFFYGLRTVSPLALGLSNVPAGRFLALNTVSALIWSVSIGLLGYSVGEAAELLLGRVQELEVWIFLGIAAVGAVLWCIHFIRRRRTRAGAVCGDTEDGNQPS